MVTKDQEILEFMEDTQKQLDEEEEENKDEVEEPEEDEIEEPEESEEEKQEKEPDIPKFASKKEFDTYVYREVQAAKDKALEPLNKQIRELKAETEDWKHKANDVVENRNLTRLEKLELEELGDTPEVKDIQELRREIVGRARENRDETLRLQRIADNQNAIGKKQMIREKVLEILLPEDKDFLSLMTTFENELLEAETEREVELLIQVKQDQFKKTVESTLQDKPERKGTKRMINKQTRAVDRSTLKGDDALAAGIADSEKKQNK